MWAESEASTPPPGTEQQCKAGSVGIGMVACAAPVAVMSASWQNPKAAAPTSACPPAARRNRSDCIKLQSDQQGSAEGKWVELHNRDGCNL
jgi:hypothetical protein